MCVQHFSFSCPKSCFSKSLTVELMSVCTIMSKYFLFIFPELAQKIITNIIVKIEQRHGDTNGGTNGGTNGDTSVTNGEFCELCELNKILNASKFSKFSKFSNTSKFSNISRKVENENLLTNF